MVSKPHRFRASLVVAPSPLSPYISFSRPRTCVKEGKIRKAQSEGEGESRKEWRRPGLVANDGRANVEVEIV